MKEHDPEAFECGCHDCINKLRNILNRFQSRNCTKSVEALSFWFIVFVIVTIFEKMFIAYVLYLLYVG